MISAYHMVSVVQSAQTELHPLCCNDTVLVMEQSDMLIALFGHMKGCNPKAQQL